MKIIFNVIRNLNNLKSLTFANIPLYQRDNFCLIKNLIWWFSSKIEEICFIKVGLNLSDI